MVDEVITAAPAAPVPEAAPVAAAGGASPAAVAPAVSSSPAPAVEIKTEAPAVSTALGGKPDTSIKDLIEDKPAEVNKTDDKVVDIKPTDKSAEVKTEGDKPVEVKTEEKPVEVTLPTYEDFKLPEGFDKTNEQFSSFTKDLAQFELDNKLDHTKVQEFGQALLDKYSAEIKGNNERITQYYNDAFEKQKKDWAEAWQKDPELGMNRIETTRKTAIKAVETFGGDADQKSAFRQFVDQTGVGDNPALIRLITNMQAKIDSLTNESNKMLPAKAPAFPGAQQSNNEVWWLI